MRPFFHAAIKRSDHFFQAFQRQYLYNVACRFCLEHHFFAGKRVNALASPGGRFANYLDLHQAWNCVNAWTPFEVTFHKCGKCIEDLADVTLCQFGFLGNISQGF